MTIANARSGERRRLPAGDGGACPCGSGFAYRACHQPVVEAPPAARLDLARRAYARSWAVNAACYEAQGLYARLARHLASHRPGPRIVDLGCGRGDGMAALQRELAGEIIGIDENPACLAAAAARVGIAAPGHRLQPTAFDDDGYELAYAAAAIPRLTGIALVQSDILRPDAALASALGPVDAVTLWFPGTHKAREGDRLVGAMGLATDEHYAVAVELAAVSFAVRQLKPGGLLQIVDRAAHRDPAVIAAAYRHRFEAMAQATPLRLIDLMVIPYLEPAAGARVAVHALDPGRRRLPTVAVSAIFRRG